MTESSRDCGGAECQKAHGGQVDCGFSELKGGGGAESARWIVVSAMALLGRWFCQKDNGCSLLRIILKIIQNVSASGLLHIGVLALVLREGGKQKKKRGLTS